ncbi:hypothetical protein MSAN_00917400 [Mycena sanguinolenta]|uniref:Uncharacterized protein n=1 Tax=Mycena sanguinolenta TaxID=230812 RepID=A0A8H7DCI3_9AGAR|nr:hypothetical protein MSAN_00917400 [Mycena sanguinolenta]
MLIPSQFMTKAPSKKLPFASKWLVTLVRFYVMLHFPKGNYFCHKCKVGGCGEHKQTDAGFRSMFETSSPRSAAETLTELHTQVELACNGVKAAVEAWQTSTSMKDLYRGYWIDDLLKRFHRLKKANLNLDRAEITQQLQDWVKQNESIIYNPFLSVKGFDVSKDTPIEILHTILLGVVKYKWHGSHTSWNPTKKETYTLCLQATNTIGLSIASIQANYIMQFANSLIDQQFKQVAQTCLFHMHDLVDAPQFEIWKVLGELLPLLWYPEIDDMDQYLLDVETAISNILDIFVILDPIKILAKNELHILVHAEADICCHGPLLHVQTESFECFNVIFRSCSILSNHLAPSCDITHQLVHQEGLKHHLTGGWWLFSLTGEWEYAGWAVRDFLSQHPILQSLLGWTSPTELEQGSVKLMPLKWVKGQPTPSCQNFTLAQTEAKSSMNIHSYDITTMWQRCVHVISKSHDICPVLSWVYAISPVTKEPISTTSSRALLALLSSSMFFVFQTLLIIPLTNIEFIFNVQHNCYTAKCTATGSQAKKQEWVDSNISESFIEHQPLEEHIINTTAFHNAHLLRCCLPPSTWAPLPLFALED